MLLAAGACSPFGEEPAAQGASTDGGVDAASADAEEDAAPDAAAACSNGALTFARYGYASVPAHASLDAPGALTVEAWIKPATLIGAREAHIVSHHDHNNSDGYVLMLFGGLALRIYSSSGSGQMDEIKASTNPITQGAWHHVAGVLDPGASKLRLFVDGAMVKEQSTSRSKADAYAGPLRIGMAAYADGFGFEGIIDEVRVSGVARYSSAFTPAYPLPNDEPDTIGSWHLTEGSGDVVKEAQARLPGGALGKTSSGEATLPAWSTPECPIPRR